MTALIRSATWSPRVRSGAGVHEGFVGVRWHGHRRLRRPLLVGDLEADPRLVTLRELRHELAVLDLYPVRAVETFRLVQPLQRVGVVTRPVDRCDETVGRERLLGVHGGDELRPGEVGAGEL